MTADGPGADGVVVTVERGSRRRIAGSYSAEVAGYSAANVRNNGAVVFGSIPDLRHRQRRNWLLVRPHSQCDFPVRAVARVARSLAPWALATLVPDPHQPGRGSNIRSGDGLAEGS